MIVLTMPKPKPVFEIDGSQCTSLDAFYAELDRVLGLADWGHNLNAFNDILRGGFGTPEGGFVLRLANADAARAGLGYPSTVAFLEPKHGLCHPTNIPSVQADLEAARRGEGQTLFDILLEILAVHGPTGDEHGDGIDVELA